MGELGRGVRGRWRADGGRWQKPCPGEEVGEDVADSEHVLVVGGGLEIPRLLREHRPGTRTSVLCQLPLLPKLQQPGAHERVLALGARCSAREWVEAAQLVDKADPITRVVTFGERDQDMAAAVGVALGLPGHDPATVAAVHNKDRMRRTLRSAGVEYVLARVVNSSEELRGWLVDHPGSWVVKPLDGSGSAGVGVITDPDRSAAAYRRCVGSTHTGRSGSASVLVEEFLHGVQISVESFSEHGEHLVVAVTRKFSDPATLVELGHVLPADLPEAVLAAAADHTRRVLTALGVRDGPCHTELVLTEVGPRTIETHLRLAGDEIPYLVRDATGVDLVDLAVRHTFGEPVLPDARRRLSEPHGPVQAIWFGTAPCTGTLTRVDGLDEARANGSHVQLAVAVGDEVRRLSDSASRPLWARADGPDAEAAVRRAREAVARCALVVSVSAGLADDVGAGT
ncbi:ATP-grasp domain-containing protein [Amycolatopsis sp. NBC_01307]|uniref:ATP-grasp domain-containing protein n=1 Tax=Amycolatopsis sp. NBC_01307 TaxID=2903561 RepID=UPI002E0EFEEF|nr:ATP-grasp domain-containing protein [Amycolatopsis sp. NBC_01307]